MSDARLEEPARLAEIARLRLREETTAQILDRYAALAAAALDMPLGLVSIVLGEAQWFGGAHGLEGWMAQTRGTPVEWSLCADVVRSDDQLVVEDARASRYAENPLVTRDGLASYAGAPLRTRSGRVVGSLCGIAPDPRAVAQAAMQELQRLADALMAELQDPQRLIG
ncbi:MAG: GAF domain-containing protein [Myxococcota bacterium]